MMNAAQHWRGIVLAGLLSAMPAGPLQAEQAQDTRLPELPPREQFAPILERPLFNDTRRPSLVSVDDEQALVSADELKQQWQLTGIVLVGQQQRALLQQREDGRYLTLLPGMPLDASWMLDSIQPDHVLMSSGDEQVRLELMTPRQTEPATAAAVPAAAAGQEAPRQPQPEAEEPRRLRQNTEVRDE